MSEPELRRAVQTCVESLARRGRPHLAQRLGVQAEQLLGLGDTRRVHALVALFDSSSSSIRR